MSIYINETDTPRVMAHKIYERMRIGESMDFSGWMMNEISQQLSPLGDLIIEELKYWDEVYNISHTSKKRMRVYKYEDKAVGGPIAHKIFKYNKVFIDKKPKVTIWRIQ